MARSSARYLFRPLLWLLWLALLAVVVPLVLGALTPIFLLVWVLVLPLAIASKDFRHQIGITSLGPMPSVWYRMPPDPWFNRTPAGGASPAPWSAGASPGRWPERTERRPR